MLYLDERSKMIAAGEKAKKKLREQVYVDKALQEERKKLGIGGPQPGQEESTQPEQRGTYGTRDFAGGDGMVRYGVNPNPAYARENQVNPVQRGTRFINPSGGQEPEAKNTPLDRSGEKRTGAEQKYAGAAGISVTPGAAPGHQYMVDGSKDIFKEKGVDIKDMLSKARETGGTPFFTNMATSEDRVSMGISNDGKRPEAVVPAGRFSMPSDAMRGENGILTQGNSPNEIIFSTRDPESGIVRKTSLDRNSMDPKILKMAGFDKPAAPETKPEGVEGSPMMIGVKGGKGSEGKTDYTGMVSVRDLSKAGIGLQDLKNAEVPPEIIAKIVSSPEDEGVVPVGAIGNIDKFGNLKNIDADTNMKLFGTTDPIELSSRAGDIANRRTEFGKMISKVTKEKKAIDKDSPEAKIAEARLAYLAESGAPEEQFKFVENAFLSGDKDAIAKTWEKMPRVAELVEEKNKQGAEQAKKNLKDSTYAQKLNLYMDKYPEFAKNLMDAKESGDQNAYDEQMKLFNTFLRGEEGLQRGIRKDTFTNKFSRLAHAMLTADQTPEHFNDI